MDDLLGRSFGGYELKELVGTGGMASIYKAYDEKLSRWVAIKIVPIQVDEGSEDSKTLLARFRLEAQAIAALRHRNILTIYSYGEEGGWAYIVMEYVPGGSLKDRMKAGKPLPWQQALSIIIPVSQALAFAHEHQIIHRDIKPANILMPQDDWPLLADFGLAKMQHTSGNRSNLTMPGQVLGTMAYAAPEQIQEGEIDERVDIYSLGIVLYELLTGRLPFNGETAFDFLMARLTDPPIPLLEANAQIPAIFGKVVDKALAQNPNHRYQTMNEFSQALLRARYELTQSIVTPLPQTVGAMPSPKSPNTGTKVRLRLKAGGQEILASGKNELIIGRAHKNVAPDIDLAPYGGSQAGVSRRHGRLVRRENGWAAEDLGSTNGMFVNGIRLTPNHATLLANGDLIRCGQIELEFMAE